jgi:hypothetical protein
MQDQMRLNSSTVLYTDTIMQQTIEKAKQEVRQESQEIIQAFEAQKGLAMSLYEMEAQNSTARLEELAVMKEKYQQIQNGVSKCSEDLKSLLITSHYKTTELPIPKLQDLLAALEKLSTL